MLGHHRRENCMEGKREKFSASAGNVGELPNVPWLLMARR